jgi:hypothetical protein
MAAALGSDVASPFRVLETGSIEVDEGSGNSFHLGPVLRKYTSAKLQVKGMKRTTVVELALLVDALGLLRSLQYDVSQFNSACGSSMSPSEVRYACYRLTRQASAFGVRVPRPGSGTVVVPGLDALVAHVEACHADQIAAARGLIAGAVVDFASLAEFFRPGVDVVDRGACTGIFGVPTAMRVRAGYFSRGKSLFGVVSTFYAALEFVVAIGSDSFAVVETHFPISEFQGTRSTSEGFENFVSLSSSVRRDLEARGRLYSRMNAGNAYLQYSPGSFLPVAKAGANRAPARARGGGRVMIDSQAAWARGVHCARSEGVAADAVKGTLKLVAQRARLAAAPQSQDSYTAGSGGQTASQQDEDLEMLLLSSLPPSLDALTWPVVSGFSFNAKSWGVALVSGLSEVEFNEDAFKRLVMPEARKRLIEALVLSHAEDAKARGQARQVKDSSAASTGTDVIAGKGEGNIFLLYGPPGVGKTLTAEAIAELLHRPLYVVSMGELGTTPEALEERLTDVLDLCVPWGALVLIDEAEMLLERRGKNDIVRNAMVCVMLRLLEYYSGILFLTTNRVESLDPAFQSRVQCALRYEALDEAARKRIWADMLARSPIEVAADVAVDGLARHELNGRQIKNVLQLALALARQEKSALAQRHLDSTLDITAAFITEMQHDL